MEGIWCNLLQTEFRSYESGGAKLLLLLLQEICEILIIQRNRIPFNSKMTPTKYFLSYFSDFTLMRKKKDTFTFFYYKKNYFSQYTHQIWQGGKVAEVLRTISKEF